MEDGEGVTKELAAPKTSKVGEQLRAVGDRLKFGAELTAERLKRPEWVREERENKARRELMSNILLDRSQPPLQPQEINIHTQRAVSTIDRLLKGNESVMFGNPDEDVLVFKKSLDGKRVAAHFSSGMLRTMATVDLTEGGTPHMRVVLNGTHEGRIESSEEIDYSLTRTAVHTFNFLVERGTSRFLPEIAASRMNGNPVPIEYLEQLKAEEVPPAKLVLGEELFNKINEREGKPLENGGVLIVADTCLGNPLASPFDAWRINQGVALSRYSEIDDFMTILACRGDKQLAEKVKAFGHTSRGTSFTAATQLAATIGAAKTKPVFPGYNPYLQYKEKTDPIRPSPAVFAMLELGRAKMNGKDAILVDEAPTTDMVYATVEQLAKEREIDMSKVPAIFMVGVNVDEQQGQAELISNALNWNYTMGIEKDNPKLGIYNSDTRKGFEKALTIFDDVTLFTPEIGVTGIPLSDFEEFLNFMGRSENKEYQKIAEIFQLRAREFAGGRRSLEAAGNKLLGRSLNIEPDTFPAQDTLISAYLIHPEWFVVRQLPLKYTTISGVTKTKENVRVVTNLTEDGKAKFRNWLWNSIKENFKIPDQAASSTTVII